MDPALVEIIISELSQGVSSNGRECGRFGRAVIVFALVLDANSTGGDVGEGRSHCMLGEVRISCF
jgi:hypothetical protein